MFREAEWLNGWAVARGGENRQAELVAARESGDRLTAKVIIADSLAVLTDQIRVADEADPFDEGSTAILALNPLAWDRTDVIEIAGDPLELIDPDTPDETPIHQTLFDSQGRMSRLYLVSVPAWGYRAFRTRKGLPGRLIDNTLIASSRRLESDLVRVTFNERGEIESVYDKQIGHSVDFTTWPNVPGELSDWQVIEAGPVRAAIQITRLHDNQPVTQRISIWRHTARVDLDTTADTQSIYAPNENAAIARKQPLRMVRFRPSPVALIDALPPVTSFMMENERQTDQSAGQSAC